MFTYSYSNIHTYDYSHDGYLYHYGKISAVNFYAYSTTNYGTISTSSYKSKSTENHGTISITDLRSVGLHKFKLMPTGILQLGDLVIMGNEPLDPVLAEYLCKRGLNIKIDLNGAIEFDGLLSLDTKQMRKDIPHLCSKYEANGSKNVYKPDAWFPTSQPLVFSTSKRTSAKKSWSFNAVSDTYDLLAATKDLFAGKLARLLNDCDVAPKAKFDAFNKAVVIREMGKNTCAKNADEAHPDHTLLQYLGTLLATATPQDFEKSILATTEPKPQSGFSWSSLFFGTSNTQEPKRTAEHKLDPYALPKGVSKEELQQALVHLIDLVSRNDYAICARVQADIEEELTAVNNRFTPEEINTKILPTIVECTAMVKENTAVMNKLVATLGVEVNIAASAPRLAAH